MKQFVREEVGFAIVPRICVRQELVDGALVEIPMPALDWPRPTRMIYRDERYISDAARALIEIVSQFNWEAPSKRASVHPAAHRRGSGGRSSSPIPPLPPSPKEGGLFCLWGRWPRAP